MAGRRELQEKIMTYNILESKLDSLLKQREMLTSKLVEIQNTLQSIDEIEKGKEVILFPVGAETYTFGKVIDNKKIVVEIGANIALEENIEEGKEALEKRKSEIENVLNSLQKNILEMSSSLDQLEPEIQELSKEVKNKSEAG